MNLRNEASSCFLDSLIVAMFTYNSSKNQFLKKILENSDEKPILKQLKKIISNPLVKSAKNVRIHLPKEMSYGQHDPGETYLFISSVMNYEPMKISTIRHVMKPNSNIVFKKKTITETTPCYTIQNNGSDSICFFDVIKPKWETLECGNFINDSKDNPVYNRTRNLTFFTEAESLVFYFNRCNGFSNQKLKNRLDMPFLIDTGIDPKTKKTREFFCYATILHLGNNIGSGHYVTVLYDGIKTFLVYDDMSGVHPLKWNSENKELIERNSVMFFYYEK
jgi:hypothetical protein